MHFVPIARDFLGVALSVPSSQAVASELPKGDYLCSSEGITHPSG